MKHIVVKNIPEDLGLQFKSLCVLKKTTMRDVIVELIRKWVEQQKGKS